MSILVKKEYKYHYRPDTFKYSAADWRYEDFIRLIDCDNLIATELIEMEDIPPLKDITEEQFQKIVKKQFFLCGTFSRPYQLIKKDHVYTEDEDIEKYLLYESIPGTNEFYHLLSSVRVKQKRRFKHSDNTYQRKINEKRINEILKPVFDDFYGEENVDIQLRGNQDAIYVVVRYGDTVISNLSKSHPIKDLYLEFRFGCDDFFGWKGLNGVRGTLTLSERATGYQHSHLPTGRESYFRDFCLGDSQVANFFTQPLQLNNPNNYEHLEEFLITVDHLVQFEDVVNPYIKISDIVPRATTVRHSSFIGGAVQRFRSLLLRYSELSITKADADHVYFSLKINQTDDLIQRLPDRLKAIKDTSGTYYDYTSYMDIIGRLTPDSDGSVIEQYPLEDVIFKGEPVIRKVIPDLENSIDRNPDVTINPHTEKALTKLYETQILTTINTYVKEENRRKEEVKA